MGIVRRAQGATTKAIPVWIVEDEQRRDRPQDPCALRVAAAGGRLLSFGGAPVGPRIARAPPPFLPPPRAPHPAPFSLPPDPQIPPPFTPPRPFGLACRAHPPPL